MKPPAFVENAPRAGAAINSGEPLGTAMKRIAFVVLAAVSCLFAVRVESAESSAATSPQNPPDASPVQPSQTADKATQDAKPNFSGTWKSRVYIPTYAETDWIDQKDSVVKVTTHGHMQDVMYPPDTYPFDGKDLTNSAHWEGRTLVLTGVISANGLRGRGQVTLALSEDGKVMTKTVHVLYSDGRRFDDRPVFDKTSEHVRPIGFRVGESISEVEEDWGTPEREVESGDKTVLYYKELEITFLDGKVVDGKYLAAQPGPAAKP
jgi:hypothetical protein